VSQQTYPVACACGKVHQCPAGYAGSKFACPCGKVVVVPGLAELRQLALQQGVPAEHELELRIRNQSLPVETECVLCVTPTKTAVMIGIICIPLPMRPTPGWWKWVLVALWLMLFVAYQATFLLLIVLVTFVSVPIFLWRRSHQKPMLGKWFTVPVRVCTECVPRLDTRGGLSEAVNATRLYRRLLEGYPEAQLLRPGWVIGTRLITPQSRQWERGQASGWAVVLSSVAVFASLKFGVEPWLAQTPIGGWNVGTLIIAGAVSLLAGLGVGRAVGGLHRHFRPDPFLE
jgi:hypothetical protein